ncbi:hypothetical protein B7P43_G16162 [Cryptotermes secundus]|uniref:Endonuclease/exonuclease/phosphatase domain-containing protein n=1 Tax=Cryptotermes secundus TaxID=105785 RepID=A0A2J7R4G0_9NEOP|nr:hypothetical protein B7P43_G16162 [Cryptotermes secundus]
MKESLRGTRYNTREIIHDVGQSPLDINRSGCTDGVRRLSQMWQKVEHMGGGYIEGIDHYVTNTWFKKPKRRIYTWKAPGGWRRHQLDYILVKHRFRNSVKDVKTLPGAAIDSDHNLLVAKFRTRLKKTIRFQKRRPRWDLEKLYAQRRSVQETLEEKLGAIEGESGNAEVQWNNIKECMLDTISDLVGKVEKIARKPWVTQEMMSKMEERRKWKNVNNEEGRRKYRRLRNELKRTMDKARKEYLEKIGIS